MAAISILTVGLLSLLGLLSSTITTLQYAEENLIARQESREILESLFSARNSQQLIFNSLQNVPDGGIFLNGVQQLKDAGPDGIIGTADDGAVETMVLPGPDGLLGTADDVQLQLTQFDRQISIVPVLRADGSPNPDLRQVTVTVRFRTAGNQLRSYQVAAYVSRYR
jgi:hypothetical protein